MIDAEKKVGSVEIISVAGLSVNINPADNIVVTTLRRDLSGRGRELANNAKDCVESW